jgi:hypothetical protein
MRHPIFRLFPVTLSQREVRLIGRLSDSDWERGSAALAVYNEDWY